MKKVFIILILLFIFVNQAYAQSSEDKKEPALTILSPKNGANIFGETVEIVFVVNDFSLVDPQKQIINKKDQGHIAIWVDKDEFNYKNAGIITKLSPITLENLAGGTHKVRMELVNNNGKSLTPKVTTELTFTTIHKPTDTFQPTVTEILNNTQKEAVRNSIDTLILFTSVTIGGLLFLSGVVYLFAHKNSR